jgi:hypothetical protein
MESAISKEIKNIVTYISDSSLMSEINDAIITSDNACDFCLKYLGLIENETTITVSTVTQLINALKTITGTTIIKSSEGSN